MQEIIHKAISDLYKLDTKSYKNSTREESYRSSSHTDGNAKIKNKVLANQLQQHSISTAHIYTHAYSLVGRKLVLISEKAKSESWAIY